MTTVRTIKEIDPRELQLWDRLELRFEFGGQESVYLARVHDRDSEFLVIDRPTWLGGAPALSPGAPLTAAFMRPDAAYAFRSHLVDKVDSPPNGWRLCYPDEVERLQRRRSYRLAAELTIQVIPLDKEDHSPQPEVRGQTADLSTCSARIRLLADLSVDQIVLLRLELPDSEQELTMVGRVKRLCPLQESDCDYGIEFYTRRELEKVLSVSQRDRLPTAYTTFDEKSRTVLANYIFAEQVRLRQRGLL
ncbi:MAG: flagellar brake protein [bacterium]